MGGDTRSIMRIAKKELTGEIYKKVDSITDRVERENSLKYILFADLENKCYLLGKKIQYLKQYKKDVFFAEVKYLFLQGKLNHFKSSFGKKDYIKIKKAMDELKEEIKNV